MGMKHFEPYCRTLKCRVSKNPCTGRPLLAAKPHIYRLNTQPLLVSEGFYPECHACACGQQLVHSLGMNIAALREQLNKMRCRIEESARIGYTVRPKSL
jgi:hypothetical protein